MPLEWKLTCSVDSETSIIETDQFRAINMLLSLIFVAEEKPAASTRITLQLPLCVEAGVEKFRKAVNANQNLRNL